LIPIRGSERSDAGEVIVYEVIGIVKKKLRDIKSSERSDADELLVRKFDRGF